MTGLHDYLVRDHARLDDLLQRSVSDPAHVDMQAYRELREGLLRHIAMEEKVLLPEARRLRGGESLPVARQLRADHAALAALLVPTPTHEIVGTILGILESHNPLEEGPDGLYRECARLAGAEGEALLSRLEAVPRVPVAPHFDGPRARENIERLLRARLQSPSRSASTRATKR